MRTKGRSRRLKEAHYAEESKLYLRGATLAQMAQQVGISLREVNRDLLEIQHRWLHSGMVNLNEARAKELARVDLLEQSYWEAWDASKQVREQTNTSRNVRNRPDPAGGPPLTSEENRAHVRRWQGTGNPLYLQGIQWCVEMRSRLLGLEAPFAFRQVDQHGNDVVPIREIHVHLDEPPPVVVDETTDDLIIEHDPADASANGHRPDGLALLGDGQEDHPLEGSGGRA